jgi:hypothetical protein
MTLRLSPSMFCRNPLYAKGESIAMPRAGAAFEESLQTASLPDGRLSRELASDNNTGGTL